MQRWDGRQAMSGDRAREGGVSDNPGDSVGITLSGRLGREVEGGCIELPRSNLLFTIPC